MAANVINAELLAKMFLAGAKNLEAKKEWINELNVFPVPDGDTGTNMVMTIMSAAKDVHALQSTNDITMQTLCKAISSGSLKGARGNSGVILSQLLRGFTKLVKESEEITIPMVADACEKAMKFTRPVIVSSRTIDGRTISGCATFFIINRDGWALTAGHLFSSNIQFKEDRKKIEEFNKQKESNPELQPDPNWITNTSFWWGWDEVRVSEAYINMEIDIAVCKLEGFKPEMITEYPVFKDPSKMRPGTSLCRTGFPFVKNATEFDEKTSSFRIRQGVLPMAFFPTEGIHTRNIFTGKSKDGGYEKLYVETSSPGIKGQSGGPIFDRNGYVAGMQAFTEHFELDFRPSIVNDKGEVVEENQFMNIGVGVHVKTIMAILDSKGIKYDIEGDDQGFRIIG